MSEVESVDREIKALREELAEMRAEQRQLTTAVEQLTQTFRNLATHLGIAAEPYVKGSREPKDRDIPGFA